MATLYQLWRLENVLKPGETVEGFDRLYIPQVGNTTGDYLKSGDRIEASIQSIGTLVTPVVGE